ncbi:hypothetical protein L1887_03108 [Cichorium endivia]|nr:hypothetical protein L1887_03108 [Cichorium endivia]
MELLPSSWIICLLKLHLLVQQIMLCMFKLQACSSFGEDDGGSNCTNALVPKLDGGRAFNTAVAKVPRMELLSSPWIICLLKLPLLVQQILLCLLKLWRR